MTNLTFEEILEAARQLSPRQKALLVQELELLPIDMGPTRDELIVELEALRNAGAFDNVESLRNKYANPTLDALTDEQLAEDIREAATEWEKEMDEFFQDDN